MFVEGYLLSVLYQHQPFTFKWTDTDQARPIDIQLQRITIENDAVLD